MALMTRRQGYFVTNSKERGVLITSIDDYSRKLLYADLFEQETTWVHIKAAEEL